MNDLIPFVSRGLIVAVALLGVSCDSVKPSARRPDIVLITIDTLRADRLGVYGYPRDTSPEIDHFAASSLTFDNILAPMSETLPTHLSILTSRHPMSLGIVTNFQVFVPDDQTPSLPQLLASLGYRTAAFVSASPLKQNTGISAGFDVFDQPGGKQRVAEETTDLALAFLDGVADEPFFLWVHYYDPHTPRLPPGDFAELFRDDQATVEGYMQERRFPSDFPNLHEINRLYDAEIRYTSYHVGRLLDRLRQSQRWDSTAIVLTADHGEALGQHNFPGHGRVQQEQIHVPLILRLPNRPDLTGTRSDALGTSMDIVPTLADNLGLGFGLQPRAAMVGVDLLSASTERRAILSNRAPMLSHKGWAGGKVRALTTKRWKFFSVEEGEDELYDLEVDPWELDNVIGQYPEIAARMSSQLEKSVREAYSNGKKDAPAQVDPELRRQLEALGYVDG